MQPGKGASLLLTLFLLFSLVPSHATAADTSPPTISNISWSPKYPIHPTEVTIFADVSDASGIEPGSVYATWCGIGRLCTFHWMEGSGNGTYRTTDTNTLPDTIGAYLEVYATDGAGNLASTPKHYVLFVDSLHIALTPAILSAQPGATVPVNGTAFYGPRTEVGDGENRSAPAEGVTVDVTVSGRTTQAIVDSTGNFAATVIAPDVDGGYPIVATATDRNLTAGAEGTLAVSAIPMPDLTVANVWVSPASPIAGDTVTLEFDVRNVGTADATEADVTVSIIRGTVETLLHTETMTVPQGDSIHRAVSWISEVGSVTLRIAVNSELTIQELDESNNVQLVPLTVSAPTTPLPVVAILGAGAVVALVLVGAGLGIRRRKARGRRIDQSDRAKDN